MDHAHTGGAGEVQVSGMRDGRMRELLTKVVLRVTRAPPVRPIGAFWTVGKVIVLVSDIFKEVDLLFVLEETSSNGMHYGVSPALKKPISVKPKSK
jgi:hypothetical protein